jgi:hypothetical protein
MVIIAIPDSSIFYYASSIVLLGREVKNPGKPCAQAGSMGGDIDVSAIKRVFYIHG